MQNAITRGFFENEVALLRPLPDPDQTLEDNKRALGRDDGDLVAASEQGKVTAPEVVARKYADETMVSDNASEVEAFDLFKQTHGGVVPVNIQVLRDWHRLHTQKQTHTAKADPKRQEAHRRSCVTVPTKIHHSAGAS